MQHPGVVKRGFKTCIAPLIYKFFNFKLKQFYSKCNFMQMVDVFEV